ncbi:MAG: carboxypeptidase-like regulatory domain-containing protein, partial [Flavobacteriales bacterium]|nr:carboxypeptidase-like regulatory domain-containing protein [Flavobacteriales bacterium]
MHLQRFLCLTICLLGSSFSLLSQGTLRGKVSDDIGSPIPFASVYLKQNTAIGTTTDFDGDYSLEIPDDQSYIVVFSFAGLQQQNLEVSVKNKEVFVLNVIMKELTTELEAAEVVVKANRGGEYYMEEMKSNAAESIDYISFATLKKTGDSNVPDAVKRVSGVSTVGGYVSVRGLVDRYIKTTLNGSRLPTLDPFTNNIKMDLFPTGLIDNVIITKTMNPDLPGDWSGAYISIETKDYPEDLQISVSTTVGFNAQSTFQEVITSQGSSTDWLGFDNGFRDIPEGVATIQSDFPNPVFNPSLYQQFSYLGIAEDLYAYGITQNTPITNGSIQHQVGLNQLGLLGAGDFNNESAVQ